jgi:hypothetical protein
MIFGLLSKLVYGIGSQVALEGFYMSVRLKNRNFSLKSIAVMNGWIFCCFVSQ